MRQLQDVNDFEDRDTRMRPFVQEVGPPLLALIIEGRAYQKRGDEVGLAGVYRRYELLRGEHGRPQELYEYLQRYMGKRKLTAKLATIILLSNVTGLKESTIRSYLAECENTAKAA